MLERLWWCRMDQLRCDNGDQAESSNRKLPGG
ncbi:hypothetical protein T12_12909 [Trichinella patagoniensis]|uniref:Uncharacterized protein n=1 Tax=Trichinella patagoniensis TaxID=990121 RepID=A0A0V0V6D9_9BILA|nr:hypothetical protein T12_12909 [Trichinella patagoniensis]